LIRALQTARRADAPRHYFTQKMLGAIDRAPGVFADPAKIHRIEHADRFRGLPARRTYALRATEKT